MTFTIVSDSFVYLSKDAIAYNRPMSTCSMAYDIFYLLTSNEHAQASQIPSEIFVVVLFDILYMY